MQTVILLSFVTITVLANFHSRTNPSKPSGFRHGPGQRPPFFDKVSRTAKEAYLDNMFDVEKPRQQILDDELEWGREQGIEDDVREFARDRAAFYASHSANVTEAIRLLPDAYAKMRSYFKDLSLSHAEREKALHRLFKAMTPELRALMQATRAFNIDKLAGEELFPSHKRRAAMKEALLKDDDMKL